MIFHTFLFSIHQMRKVILTNVIRNTSRHTSSGTATFGSNLRADTLDCTICRNAFIFELTSALVAAFVVALANQVIVGLNII
jgi:hypothetical protein